MEKELKVAFAAGFQAAGLRGRQSANQCLVLQTLLSFSKINSSLLIDEWKRGYDACLACKSTAKLLEKIETIYDKKQNKSVTTE